jgi:hypothetical protein
MMMAGMPSAIGTLASVEPPVSTDLRPKAVLARIAASTITESTGVRPAGRSPISRVLALRLVVPQRLFSSATAASTAARICFSVASIASICSERMSIAMRASGEMVLTEVPPAMVPTVKVVLGKLGVCTSEIFAIARPRPWMALGTWPKAM